MDFTKEDINFIENILNQCITTGRKNIIYYITSKNIIRQLKYNNLYNINNKINHLSGNKKYIIGIDKIDKIIYFHNSDIYDYLKSKYNSDILIRNLSDFLNMKLNLKNFKLILAIYYYDY